MKIIKVLQLLIPKIVKVTEETIIGEEGCLSFPLLYLKVKRSYGLVVECLDSTQKSVH